MYLTDTAIEKAKKNIPKFYSFGSSHHGATDRPSWKHNDCIRIAYEWLDAQIPLDNTGSSSTALKHIIENWACCGVSGADVEVAAYLHPNIFGKYPEFNLSKMMVFPDHARIGNFSRDRVTPIDSEFTFEGRGDDQYAYEECLANPSSSRKPVPDKVPNLGGKIHPSVP